MSLRNHFKPTPRILLAFGLVLLTVSTIAAQSGGTAGPHAKVHPISPSEVTWTEGFWANRIEALRERMFPTMKLIMEGKDRSHYLENFKIAAGLAEGRSRGASFNDGDFYKWMQTACYLLAIDYDAALDAHLDEIIRIIARAQRDDGYLHTPVIIKAKQGDPEAIPFRNRHNFELYNMGHLFTTAALHYRITGKESLLDIARKAADFLEVTFTDAPPEAARSSVCPSHYMGMIDLWRITREPRYLRLVETFFRFRSEIEDGGDDNQDRIPFEKQREAVGHAVRANYLYAGAADLFMETGNDSYWRPLQPIWENVVSKKMYITGGCGALYDGASPDASKNQRSITRTHQAYGRNYQLPNVTAHNETCANIGNVLWNWRMFLATGEARYIDILELTLYNSVLSGVSLDGEDFFYTNPLRVTEPLPTLLRWSRTRVPYVSAFCCPPNVLRTLGESATYAYGKAPKEIWITLYGSNRLKTKISDIEVTLTQTTEFPWDGRVKLEIDHNQLAGAEFSILPRIPAWAPTTDLKINGKPIDLTTSNQGSGMFYPIRRTWMPGDEIELAFSMPVRLIESHPLVEETRNHLAVKRGPLVYCLEGVDLPSGKSVLSTSIPTDATFKPVFQPDILGGTTVLEGTLQITEATNWKNQLYREYRHAPTKPTQVNLIPYAFWANRGSTEMAVWLPVATTNNPSDD